MKNKEKKKYYQSLKQFRNADDPDSTLTGLDITIILVGTETTGNIGSIARSMRNFAFTKLILFNPACEWSSTYAHGFAMHGKNVLDDARVIQCETDEEIPKLKELFKQFDVIVGTSAKGVDYKNIKRVPIFIDELDLIQLDPSAKIAIVFGRESTGLSNDEIILTDFSIRIPANPEYPTMNLSHACSIVLFTLYKKLRSDNPQRTVLPASKVDRDFLLQHIDQLSMKVLATHKNKRTLMAFKNLLGRAFLSQKEFSLILGFFRKIELGLENSSTLKLPEEEDNEEKIG